MSLPLYAFDNSIPFGTNNPSADQPKMLQNNQSDLSIWATDHFGYNVNGSGYHQQVRMGNRTVTPLAPNPPTVITGFGGLYCDNTASTTTLNETGLWYTPDGTGDIYPLTRTIHGSYSLFSAFVNNYNTVGANFTGGWTFVAGELLLQYGATGLVSTAGITVPFPVPFKAAPYSVVITPEIVGGTRTATVTAITSTGFTASASSNLTNIRWLAIGF